jgi:putative ABC transport system permease protein
MIKNLLLVAFRSLKRDRAYSLLNILGLTIGITFSLLLIFYVQDELGYDRSNLKADRIYRIASYVQEPENSMKWAMTQFPLGPTLKKEFPEVEQSARFVSMPRSMYKTGDRQFYEERIFYADSNLFEIFTYPFLEGNAKTALVAPHSLVLTETMAEKYFGKGKKALGQTLENAQGEVFHITGIAQDPPRNSHILFNALISSSTLPKNFSDNWGMFGFFTYVLLYPKANAQAFEKKLLPLYDKYMAPIFAQFKVKIHYGVQSITRIHLYSDLTGEPEQLGSISYIYIFSAVALFMLVIACINYMNLTTARSARRAKEIGVRKVTGSLRSQLIFQFLTESTLIALLSMLLALALVWLLLPSFNTLAGKFISFRKFFELSTFLILLGLILFVGLLGGSYPAFYLSRFNPVTVLKGQLAKSSSNSGLRRVLVTLQFSISMVMLICTLVVYRQLKFLREKDLGFNKDQVITLRVDGDRNLAGKILALKNELKKYPGIVSVSTANTAPGGTGMSFNLFTVESGKGDVNKGISCYAIDEDYLKTLGMKITLGRNFSGISDTLRSILVNENMAKNFSWADPIGKRVRFPGDTSKFYLEVIGVVKDFNQTSLYNPISPLILFYRPSSNGVQIKLSARNIPASLAFIEKSWKALLPGSPFQYSFLDQDFDAQYSADQKRGQIFTAFASLTLLITCLGLLGLVAFTTEQRQKEISIRKIMGAGIRDIVPMIVRNFVALVGISCLIAFPVAWYFMHRWLEVFAYKSALSPLVFVLSALVVLLITLLTVSFHTIRASVANPVKNLRAE